MKNEVKKFFLIILILFIASFSYFGGFLVGHKNIEFEKGFVPRLINTQLSQPKEVDFSLFWEVFNKIEEKYPGEINRQNLVYGAIKGMVAALADPYSSFFAPGEFKEFLEDLTGQFEGIGIEISQKQNKFLIVAPLDGSPAQKAGLKAGDEILKIDGVETSLMTFEEVISKIRGKKGTEVTLTILRQGWGTPRDFTIKRGVIKVESVSYQLLEGRIGYLKISQFGDDTIPLLKKYLKTIEKDKPAGIILDLRNNPGGYLDGAVDVASVFLPAGKVVVIEQDKSGERDEKKTTLSPSLQNYKVVVLINKGSASGAEIVAGALKDWERATLVGEITFGKGSVQELEQLPNNAALRLTIAKWLTPKGTEINGAGIAPDVAVAETEVAGQDPQLDKAKQLLQ